MRIYLFSIENFNASEHLIHIGDICLLYDECALYIWIENNDSQKERLQNQIKSTLICAKILISCPSNPMIFSYDGVSKRNGNRDILKLLICSLENNTFNDVLKNALNILEYKEDRIDIVPITQLFEQIKIQHVRHSQPTINKNSEESTKTELKEEYSDIYSKKNTKRTISKTKEYKKIYPPQSYYFYDYLGEEAKAYWMAHYLYDISTHVIYNNIRKMNKKKYSEAFDNFRKDHSDLNIYSRKEHFDPIATVPQHFEEIDHIQALFNLISANGYTQICNNKWKTPDGQLINISIEKLEDNSIQETLEDPIKCVAKDDFKSYKSTPINKPNIINKDKLKETFKHVSSTYKFFWFLSILTISENKKSHQIFYKELVAKMISIAYPYMKERLSFGTTDKFHDIIQSLILTETFQPFDTNIKNEERIIFNYNIAKIHIILNHLLLNVPYRFLSSWIPFTNNKEVISKSQESSSCAPYALYPDYIELNAEWHRYFKENNNELLEFTKSRLKDYLLRINKKMH